MPRPTSWTDLQGQRVGLWGIGVEGRASLRRLRSMGVEPVLIDQESGQSEDGTRILGLGDGGFTALRKCDYVVKSPGISRYDDETRILTKDPDGPRLVGGLGLWLAEVNRRKVVCVTGTKGKSTTASIAGTLIRGLGYRCFLGGNLGDPPWDTDEDYDWWIVETSSYQALDVAVGPQVVVVTSLSQDHLTWHRGPENYYRDKLSLCTRPGVQTVVADGHDGLLRRHSQMLGNSVEWVDEPVARWADGLQLLGAHNLRNAALAKRALIVLGVQGAADDEALARASAAFTPLPSRLTVLDEINGVTFVDDSLSTNVLSTLAAVDAFPNRRVALLVGGFERDIDYRPLAGGLARRSIETLVLTVPDNGPRIRAVLAAHPGAPPAIDCPSVQRAVLRAFHWARPGGVVLLSPAAPSFGVYDDYQARAHDFAQGLSRLRSEVRFPR